MIFIRTPFDLAFESTTAANEFFLQWENNGYSKLADLYRSQQKDASKP
ncbi:hypothetical protein [Aliiglaciecola sp. LCG003]|nr:hypothetical protein [Aliiglaciecola sp. LCG003]WJG09698.1 hypothetical protein QR722_01275 [Aliiglaciecola sp. LCG003]